MQGAPRVGRIVAGLLGATGEVDPAARAEADRGLDILGQPPLIEPDFAAPATPEELAPHVPLALRAGVLDLLYALAGDEPIRRRLADSYAGLWHTDADAAPAPRGGHRVLRWLVGRLPRHQIGRDATTSGDTMDDRTPYRHDPSRAQEVVAPRDPLRDRVAKIREEFLAVVAAVEQVIVGKRDVIERVLTAMAARGHVLLVDVPGVGKTQLCKAIAAAIETRFGRVQLTPDLLPMDLTGSNVYDARAHEFVFRPGPIFTHVLLADELNRATPKTQSALLEVMEERQVTVDGTTHVMAEPFQVLATMNPLDHQGTYALPAAQIDRFMMMIEVGLPSPEDEVRVLDYHLGASPLANVRPVITRAAYLRWCETVAQIHVTPELKRAAVEYINGLRRTAEDGQQLSPRATIAWVRAAQAHAMLAGREFVTMVDLIHIAPDVLRHRMWTDSATVRERLRAVVLASTASGGR